MKEKKSTYIYIYIYIYIHIYIYIKVLQKLISEYSYNFQN